MIWCLTPCRRRHDTFLPACGRSIRDRPHFQGPPHAVLSPKGVLMRVLFIAVALACLLVAPFAYADPASDARAALALRQAPVPPQAPSVSVMPTPRPDGLGYCSPRCACSCQEGVPCTCGTSRTSQPASQAAPQGHVHPAVPPVSYYAPAPAYAPAMSFGGGGASCGRGG